MDVVFGDGGVLRVNGVSTLSEMIMDGLVSPEDRASRYPGQRLGEVEDLAWAFAVAGEAPVPYDAYVVTAAAGGLDEEEEREAEPEEEDERRAEQPETD